MHVIKSATFPDARRWTSAIDSNRRTHKRSLSPATQSPGSLRIRGNNVFFQFIFLRAADNRHCCIYATPRASIQARRRVHKTIFQPLRGSLARSLLRVLPPCIHSRSFFFTSPTSHPPILQLSAQRVLRNPVGSLRSVRSPVLSAPLPPAYPLRKDFSHREINRWPNSSTGGVDDDEDRSTLL